MYSSISNTSKRNAFYVRSVVLGNDATEHKNLVHTQCCSCPLTTTCLKEHTEIDKVYSVPICTVAPAIKETYANIGTVYGHD